VIRKSGDGWIVVSEKGKKLSRKYKSRAEAHRRLAQIEYFKNRGKK
jgi:hypothetical protein